MNNNTTQTLDAITDVYVKCKASNYYTEQKKNVELLDTKFDKVDRITCHGMIDIVINLENKHCGQTVLNYVLPALTIYCPSLISCGKQFVYTYLCYGWEVKM